MTKQFELLAPGGDIDSIKAAILAGADAIYCGLDKFNARNRAVNISLENLHGLVRLAHEYDCKIFITLNIIILENEVPEVVRLLNKLVNIDIDGVILQDLGLFHIIKQHFPSLDVHASTQLNTHNPGQIDFLAQLRASRVNLSRELNIHEIKRLADYGHERNVLMEVFVHGSYCIGFSGLCYISSAKNGNSGNRGRCSQPCRDQYQPTKAGKNFPLNMKDNSAFDDMALLADAGVYSLKVEGRIKKPHYVYTVVDKWRQQIDNYCQSGEVSTDKEALYKVFNRDFSNGYLKGTINNSMFIDNPRANSVKHFTQVYECKTEDSVQDLKRKLYDENTQVIQTLEARSVKLNIDKLKIALQVSGQQGEPLCVKIITQKATHTLKSETYLNASSQYELSQADLEDKFKPLTNDKQVLTSVDVSGLAKGLILPFKELTQLRDKAIVALNGGKPLIAPVEPLKLSRHAPLTNAPKLNVLLSNEKDIPVCVDKGAQLYFHLPSAMKVNLNKQLSLFEKNPSLTPYFPAILIDEDFDAAVEFLRQVQPTNLITNNTGIAFEAAKLGLGWIAGPQLNLTNSYALACIEEEFDATGAFISNEINKKQMRHIIRPKTQNGPEFKVFHSIYHPITLLTSRQCLFHQTVGCKIKAFDEKCLKNCKKQASIINLNTAHYVIDKQKGEHNHMFSDHNFLNLEVLNDIPDLFTDIFIDLRDIQTQTQVALEKPELIELFASAIAGQLEKVPAAQEESFAALKQALHPTTMAQYKKGL